MPSRKTKRVDVEPLTQNQVSPTVRMVKVANLRTHPRQDELVGDMPREEFDALVADIAKNGVQTPLILMADGRTTVAGHQRARAATQCGLVELPSIVRKDLIEADDPRTIELLVGDNLYRRQLSTLQQAKAALHLAEIECDRKGKTLDSVRKPLIDKSVAKRLRCSRKNAQRYISVSKTPDSIQQAFERGLLP